LLSRRLAVGVTDVAGNGVLKLLHCGWTGVGTGQMSI
jgi:hypothetical protein